MHTQKMHAGMALQQAAPRGDVSSSTTCAKDLILLCQGMTGFRQHVPAGSMRHLLCCRHRLCRLCWLASHSGQHTAVSGGTSALLPGPHCLLVHDQDWNIQQMQLPWWAAHLHTWHRAGTDWVWLGHEVNAAIVVACNHVSATYTWLGLIWLFVYDQG